MRHLFVDTFYLIALAHPRDQWRERVLTFSRSLRDYRLFTVDEVLADPGTHYLGPYSTIFLPALPQMLYSAVFKPPGKSLNLVDDDFVSATGNKWVLAPMGIGLACTASSDVGNEAIT